MAIEVLIKRRIKQGDHAKKLVPLILQMRALALHQPGYISGKTLCDLEHPGDCLVISIWETVNDWNRWKQNKERAHIEPKNAEMKRFHGMERARYWGLTKVNVQFIITAIVVNVKRLANVTGSVCYLKTC